MNKGYEQARQTRLVDKPDGLDGHSDDGGRQLHNPRRASVMVKDVNGDVWLTPQEAADRLCLSKDRIYHIKDYLTHRKGSGTKARVYFLESTLFDDYMSI